MTLLAGDCLEQLKTLPDNSVDMVLTDPPYGTTACKWDTIIPFEPMWAELKRVAKADAAICLFGSEPFASALRMSNRKNFRYDWIWHKSRPSGMALARFQPMRNHENISVFYNSRPLFQKQLESRAESSKQRFKQGKFRCFGSGNSTTGIGKLKTEPQQISELRNPTTIKYFQSVTDRSKSRHPTQKPVALLEYLIKTYTREGETVLDFCMGSGSTGVAAKNLNRDFIGIELNEEYFEIAKKRVTA